MGSLLNTPSAGRSEVLDTLNAQGAIAAGVQLVDLGPMVSNMWGGDENREGSDPVFEADLRTIVAALATSGYIVGHADLTGAVVSLTAAPPPTTRISLTGAGRVQARAPRPRPRKIRGR